MGGARAVRGCGSGPRLPGCRYPGSVMTISNAPARVVDAAPRTRDTAGRLNPDAGQPRASTDNPVGAGLRATGQLGRGTRVWARPARSSWPAGQNASPRANAAGRALPDPWTSASWTAGGVRRIRSCGFRGSTADPSRTQAGVSLVFPSPFIFLTPCPSRPRSSLKLHRTE